MLTWKGQPVPYVTAWSSERRTVEEQYDPDTGEDRMAIGIVDNDDGTETRVLTYVNGEKKGDRDEHGVLWLREGDTPGKGYPLFRAVQSRRQRRCMLRPACQVCGFAFKGDPTWLVDDIELSHIKPMEDRHVLVTATAPCCERCMPIAAAACPHLRKNKLYVLRIYASAPVGVMGDWINPRTAELEKMQHWYYSQDEMRTVYAKQQLLGLIVRSVTPYG